MRRKRMSRRRSRKNFKKGFRTNKKNRINSNPMRGGYRI